MLNSKKYVGYVILLLLLASSVGSNVYLYRQWDELKRDPQLQAQRETQATLEKIGRLMVLPKEEAPTIATVSDPEKLKDQAFFAHAAQGDVVLLYAQARKAVLYRPSEDKIVEVAPINTTDERTPSIKETPVEETPSDEDS